MSDTLWRTDRAKKLNDELRARGVLERRECSGCERFWPPDMFARGSNGLCRECRAECERERRAKRAAA